MTTPNDPSWMTRPTQHLSHASDASLRAAFVVSLQPEKFGAKGDGTTDDTAALVAAMQAASAAKLPLVLTGTYRFSSITQTLDDLVIEWRPGAKLLCTLDKTVDTIPVQITGSRVRLLNPTLDYTVAVNIDTDSQTRPASADSFRLGGPDSGHPADDIEVTGGLIRNSRSTPVRIRYATRARVHRVTIDEALGNGIAFEACQDSSITACRVRRTGDDLIVAVASNADYLAGKSRNVQVIGNHVAQGYANGINFTGVDGGVIAANLIENTWAPGIRVWKDVTFSLGSCADIAIAPNTIRSPGRYFGPGQFKTAVMAVPAGVYCIGGVSNVVLHQQTISNAQGEDVALSGGGVVDLRPATPAMHQVVNDYIVTTGVNVQTATTTQSVVTYVPIRLIGKATTRNMNINVTTGVAGSTIRLGIYANDNGGPGALIAEAAATVDSSTTGLKTATITQALGPGTYWLAAVAQGGAPSVRALQGRAIGMPAAQDPGQVISGWIQNAVTGALPATASIQGATSTPTAITLGV